jgi:two-component system chemotaxis response regulator CheB
MGRDGADSLLRLKESGAHTIAQSEASCVVFGMPREAIKIGAATEVLDLPRIAAELTRLGRNIAATPTRSVA